MLKGNFYMTETDKYGFKKVREGGWWVVLNNYKTSGMKITLTLRVLMVRLFNKLNTCAKDTTSKMNVSGCVV